MAKRKSARELADEKRRFYMYLSYREQMEMLTDEELGRAMRHVYTYADEGVKVKDESPLVNMLVSVITVRYDIDKENYREMVEQNRENGQKGGLKSGEVRREQAALASFNGESEGMADEKTESEYQKGTTASFCEPMGTNKADRGDRCDEDEIDEKDMIEELLNCSSNSCRRSGGQDEAVAINLIPYGEDDIPTTVNTLEQVKALANELYDQYLHTMPSRHDYEQVFHKCYSMQFTVDGQHYAAFDEEKAGLLRHAFQQAADQQKVTWKYLDGIYNNYEKHGVTSVEEAVEHEFRWKRGELV